MAASLPGMQAVSLGTIGTALPGHSTLTIRAMSQPQLPAHRHAASMGPVLRCQAWSSARRHMFPHFGWISLILLPLRLTPAINPSWLKTKA